MEGNRPSTESLERPTQLGAPTTMATVIPIRRRSKMACDTCHYRKIKCNVDKCHPCKNCEKNSVQCTMMGPTMRPPRSTSGSSSAAAAAAVAVALATAANARITSSNGGYGFSGPFEDGHNWLSSSSSSPSPSSYRGIGYDHNCGSRVARLSLKDEEYQPPKQFSPMLRRVSASARVIDDGSGTSELASARRKLHSYSSSPSSLRNLFIAGAGGNGGGVGAGVGTAGSNASGSRPVSAPIFSASASAKCVTPTTPNYPSGCYPSADLGVGSGGDDYFALPISHSASSTPSTSSGPSSAPTSRGPSSYYPFDDPTFHTAPEAHSSSLPPTPTHVNVERMFSAHAGITPYDRPIAAAATAPYDVPSQGMRRPCNYGQGMPRRTSSSPFLASQFNEGAISTSQLDRRSSSPWISYGSSSQSPTQSVFPTYRRIPQQQQQPQQLQQQQRTTPEKLTTNSKGPCNMSDASRQPMPQVTLVRSNSTPSIFSTTWKSCFADNTSRRGSPYDEQSIYQHNNSSSSTESLLMQPAQQQTQSQSQQLSQQEAAHYNHHAPLPPPSQHQPSALGGNPHGSFTDGGLSQGARVQSQALPSSPSDEHFINTQRAAATDITPAAGSSGINGSGGTPTYYRGPGDGNARSHHLSFTHWNHSGTEPIAADKTRYHAFPMSKSSPAPHHNPVSGPIPHPLHISYDRPQISPPQSVFGTNPGSSTGTGFNAVSEDTSRPRPAEIVTGMMKAEPADDDMFDSSLALVLDDHLSIMDHFDMIPEIEVYTNPMTHGTSSASSVSSSSPSSQSSSSSLPTIDELELTKTSMTTSVATTSTIVHQFSGGCFSSNTNGEQVMTSPRASLYSFQPSSTVPPQQSSTMAVPNQNAPHHPLSALVNNHSSERLVKREPGHGHGECDPLRYFDEPEAYLSHASASAPTSVSSQASTVVASTISITDSTTATSTTMDGQTGEMRLSYPKEEPMEIKLGSDHPHQRPQPQQYGHAPYALARHHPLDPVPMGSYSLSSH